MSIENPQNRKENSPLSDREIPIIRKKHVESFRFFHLSSRKESSIHCFLPNRVIRVRLCQRLPERFAFNVLSLGHPVPVPGKNVEKLIVEMMYKPERALTQRYVSYPLDMNGYPVEMRYKPERALTRTSMRSPDRLVKP